MILDLFGDVGYEITLSNIKNQIDSSNDTDNIEINLFSYGGILNEGLAIHDWLKPYNPTVNIYGICASAANFIAWSAPKGKLNIYENAEWLSHQARVYTMGGFTEKDTEDLSINLKKANKAIAEYIDKRTGIGIEEATTIVMNEQILTAEEAKKLKLVDNIIEVSEKENDIDNILKNHFTIMTNSLNTDNEKRLKDYFDWYRNKKENSKLSQSHNIDNKQEDINNNKLEVTDMDKIQTSEQTTIDNQLVSELLNKVERLEKENTELTNSVELREKDNLINSYKEQIANYEKERQERLLNEAKERNAGTIAIMNSSNVQFNEELMNSVETIENADTAKTIANIVNTYEETLRQYKQDGEKLNITKKENTEVVNGLTETEQLIKVDSKDFDDLVVNVAKELGINEVQAQNTILDNPTNYNVEVK